MHKIGFTDFPLISTSKVAVIIFYFKKNTQITLNTENFAFQMHADGYSPVLILNILT